MDYEFEDHRDEMRPEGLIGRIFYAVGFLAGAASRLVERLLGRP